MSRDNERAGNDPLLASGVRALTWISVVAGVFFLLFVAGIVVLFATIFKSFGAQACVGQLVCDGTSLTLPIVLLAVGFVGLLVTGIVGNVVAVRHLGLGAMA